MPRRSLLILLALAATWGSSYLLIAVALEELSPGAVTAARLVLGALVVVPLALRQGVLGAARGRYLEIAGLALLQLAGPFTLIAYGEEQIPSALAGTLVAATPVFTALLYRGGSSRLQLLGVFVGFVGVAVLLGLDATAAGDGGLLGALLVVLAALGYSIGAHALSTRFRDLPQMTTLSVSMSISALLVLPVALVDPPHATPDLEGVVAVLLLGLVGTGVAFVLFYRLIASVGPHRGVLVTYLAPVFAVGYGVTLRDEPVGAATVSGLLLVLAGAFLAGRSPGARRSAVPSGGR